jgi:hypothetical protein
MSPSRVIAAAWPNPRLQRTRSAPLALAAEPHAVRRTRAMSGALTGRRLFLLKRSLGPIAAFVPAVLLAGTPAPARMPDSVICEFERIATAELDKTGKIATGGDSSKGEMVISNLNSGAPVGSGNIGSVALRVLAQSADTIWLGKYR